MNPPPIMTILERHTYLVSLGTCGEGVGAGTLSILSVINYIYREPKLAMLFHRSPDQLETSDNVHFKDLGPCCRIALLAHSSIRREPVNEGNRAGGHFWP